MRFLKIRLKVVFLLRSVRRGRTKKHAHSLANAKML
jgi:hypothetical protein